MCTYKYTLAGSVIIGESPNPRAERVFVRGARIAALICSPGGKEDRDRLSITVSAPGTRKTYKYCASEIPAGGVTTIYLRSGINSFSSRESPPPAFPERCKKKDASSEPEAASKVKRYKHFVACFCRPFVSLARASLSFRCVPPAAAGIINSPPPPPFFANATRIGS